jgi:hypothetical protein
MVRLIRLVLLVALVAVAAAAYVFHTTPRVAEAPPPAETWPGLAYQSEDEWIVSQTALAVLDLARYVAAGRATPAQQIALSDVTLNPASPRDFVLGIGDETITVRVDTHVWDPRVYRGLAATVPATLAATDATEDVIAALTDISGPVLQRQNDIVSAALSGDPRNAAHHEAAAFLLASLAFREASGFFYDPRLIMSRVTAHLAVARALRGERNDTTTAGRFAHAMLLTLAGHTRESVTMVDAMATEPLSSAAQSWRRAIKRRATFDWREVPEASAPIIERVEYMRALGRMLTTNATLEYYEAHEHELEAVPDWGWRTLDLGLTVANGHKFVRPTYVLTQYEAATVLRAINANTAESFSEALGTWPAVSAVDRTRGGLRVIDAGTWGAFYQRQLAHVTSTGSRFFRDVLDSHAWAIDFEVAADAFVGNVPLWPLVKRLRARNADEYDMLAPSAIQVVQTMPERVPYMAWFDATQRAPKDAKRLPVPVVRKWFVTVFPTGTAFESRRLNQATILPQDFIDQADAMHDISPWDPHVTLQWSTARCAQTGCTPQQQREHFDLIADYHLGTVRRFAFNTGDPVGQLTKLCSMSVDECYQLANWFVSEDRPDEAVTAYEHYIRVGRDRVGVSNRLEWLVRHYQRTGRSKDARRVAEIAAETGSAAGLGTLAGFLERAGDAARARQVYENINERYDDGHQLLAHLLRRADVTGQPSSDAVYQQLITRYFKGPVQPEPAGVTTAPQTGMRVKTTTPWVEKQGFRVGDIVTAVDGVRMSTNEQFAVLYDRSFDAPLKFTVWRKDRYLTIEGAFRQYYYGVDLETYVPPPVRPTSAPAGN